MDPATTRKRGEVWFLRMRSAPYRAGSLPAQPVFSEKACILARELAAKITQISRTTRPALASGFAVYRRAAGLYQPEDCPADGRHYWSPGWRTSPPDGLRSISGRIEPTIGNRTPLPTP